VPKASNDDSTEKKTSATPKPPADYEKINEAPKNKKKGWWNRLVD